MEQQRRLQGWIKRNDRKSVRFDTWLVRSDQRRVDVRVTNISCDGCRIEADEILPIGEKLNITLPRFGDVEAQVRWSLLGEAGLQFLVDQESAGEEHFNLGAQSA